MTGSMQVLAGSGGGSAIAFTAGAGNLLVGTTGLRSATVSMLSDGTGSGSRSPSGGTGTAFCNPWFFPSPTTGIGSSYWVKLTINSQATTTITGTTGSVISLSGGASWTFQNSATNNEGTGTGTFTVYSDAGGTNLVATGSLSWDVGFAP